MDDEILNVVFEDESAAEAVLQASDTQFNRRAYVRAMFAIVEAFINWLKFRALQEHKGGTLPPLTAADLAILREESYELDSTGQSQVRRKFLALDANYRFVVRVYLQRPSGAAAVDYGSKGWADFQAGLKVRHRLAHPKCAADELAPVPWTV